MNRPAPFLPPVRGVLPFSAAAALNRKYYELFKNLFIEPNPVSIKYALQRAGIIGSAEVRLPLCPMSDSNRKILDDTLDALGSEPFFP